MGRIFCIEGRSPFNSTLNLNWAKCFKMYPASNGDPRRPDSLHYIGSPGQFNAYQKVSNNPCVYCLLSFKFFHWKNTKKNKRKKNFLLGIICIISWVIHVKTNMVNLFLGDETLHHGDSMT